MGQMMMNTLIPLYAYDLGATASVVGIVAGAFAVTALLIRPFAGPAFDSFSKKWILFASLIVITAATFFYSISSSVPALIATRLLHGAGIACAAPMVLTMASESLPPEKMNSGLSIFSLAYAIAQSIGPAFGLWLLDIIGYQWVFRTSTLFMLVACVLALVLKEPGQKVRKPYEFKLSRMFARQAFVPAGLNALLSLPFACIGSFVVIYGTLKGVEGLGLYFTVYALCLLATRPLFGTLADKFGSGKVIPLGLICFAFSLFLISRADSLVSFLVAAFVGACGYGAVAPLLQSLTMLCAPHDARGAASNTNFTGLDIGNLTGPALGGFIAETLHGDGMGEAQSYAGMYLVLIVPVAAAFTIFLIKRRRLEQLVRENAEKSVL